MGNCGNIMRNPHYQWISQELLEHHIELREFQVPLLILGGYIGTYTLSIDVQEICVDLQTPSVEHCKSKNHNIWVNMR